MRSPAHSQGTAHTLCAAQHTSRFTAARNATHFFSNTAFLCMIAITCTRSLGFCIGMASSWSRRRSYVCMLIRFRIPVTRRMCSGTEVSPMARRLREAGAERITSAGFCVRAASPASSSPAALSERHVSASDGLPSALASSAAAA